MTKIGGSWIKSKKCSGLEWGRGCAEEGYEGKIESVGFGLGVAGGLFRE